MRRIGKAPLPRRTYPQEEYLTQHGNDLSHQDEDFDIRAFWDSEPDLEEQLAIFGAGYSCKPGDLSLLEKKLSESQVSCNFCQRPDCAAQDDLALCRNSRRTGSSHRRAV